MVRLAAWTRRWLLRLGLLALLVVLGVNLAVRALGGGAPHPLSPLSMAEKLHALRLVLRHHARCLGRPHAPAEVVIQRAAARHGVPKALMLSMGRAESNLEPHRISHAGAMGLMQLMPDTARWLGVGDPFDSEANADAAARYLRILQARYRGDAQRIAAAYNAGPGRVPRAGPLDDLPGETRHYVRRVTGRSVLPAATQSPRTRDGDQHLVRP